MTRRISNSAAGFLLRVDGLLRGRDPLVAEPLSSSLRYLLVITLTCGVAYGATMGTFGAAQPGRWVQTIYAAAKVPMLLLVSFALALPSFFVLNTVVGLRSDFPQVLHALVSTQAGLTVVLASLAPFTAFWYVSSGSYNAALLFNGAMFALATLCGQWMLRRGYRRLVTANPRHRVLMRIWLVLYSFVAIQMAWVLRPFIGSPSVPPAFFRPEAWGNAYIEIVHMVLRAI